MRKLKFAATFTLKDERIHARLVISDQDEKVLFDRIARTPKIPDDQIGKLPTNEFIVKMIDKEFEKGIGDYEFEKVRDNLAAGDPDE